MNQTIVLSDAPPSTSLINARAMLGLLLVFAAVVVVDYVVANRGDIGTDTSQYAGFFDALRLRGALPSRFEPVFYYLSLVLAATGMSFPAYLSVLFLVMIGTVLVATRNFHEYLQSQSHYLTFLIASLMFLFISPVMSNATINVVRQGLASLLVFTALLAFHRRQWRAYVLWGLLATGFHYSSVLYLLCAPVLLLKPKLQRIVGIGAFLAYCSGFTMILVRALAPSLYAYVMTHDAIATYRSGVRLDFAAFSLFWYLLPLLAAPLVREPVRENIKHSTTVYLVLMLPFFLIGWGSFSNRYLLPAWLAVSLILAAICCDNRFSPLRNPIVLRLGMVAACGVFCFYVTRGILM